MKSLKKDKGWDGLKVYLTNSKLNPTQIIENYKNLWHIEKAFRMSKTNLRIRPIYQRLRKRIEAHICLSFTAYAIYRELERVLHKEYSPISLQQAAELTHTMYEVEVILPEARQIKKILLQMDKRQMAPEKIIARNF